jgi:Zn-dependent protease with chaperone function
VSVWSDDLIHPADRAALQSLRSVPGFGAFVAAFMKVFADEQIHGYNMARKIRLGPKQLTKLYELLPPACEVLGIAEPEFYLEMDPRPNAYAMGEARPSITITSGLVESMDEEELRAVVGHECGHIACHHMLYNTMVYYLVNVGMSMFGPMRVAAEPVKWALLFWNRRSEFSADRAGAVVMGDHRAMSTTMVRLAGGPKAITGEVDIELYMKQAEEYDRLVHDSAWDRMLQYLAVKDRSHPFCSVRAREIANWVRSPEFGQALMARRDLLEKPKCPACGGPVETMWKFCQHCGADLRLHLLTGALAGIGDAEGGTHTHPVQ